MFIVVLTHQCMSVFQYGQAYGYNRSQPTLARHLPSLTSAGVLPAAQHLYREYLADITC